MVGRWLKVADPGLLVLGFKGMWVLGMSHDSCVKGIVEPPDGSDGVVALFLEDDPDTRDVGESAASTGRGSHMTWL